LKGLLLAGGHGTRLRPLTYTGNKHTLPIANKPMLMYGLEQLREAGTREIGVILGPMKEGIRETLGDGSRSGVQITYIEQNEPLGIAHAIATAREFLKDDSFTVYLGDNLLKEKIGLVIKEFESENYDATILLSEVKDPSRYGVAEIEGERVVRLVEKPKNPRSNLALVGVYLLSPNIFPIIETLKPSWRNELEITEAIQTLIDSGCKVHFHKVSGWWKDTGRPEDILEANQLVLSDMETQIEGRVEVGVVTHGKIQIGRGTFVEEGSTLRGPLIVGRNCEVGAGTYIGPYTSIGDNVRIQKGELENSIVMDDTVIQCSERIVDSLIGRNSKILSAGFKMPRGFRLIIGENTTISV